jgi:hypothetical protein
MKEQLPIAEIKLPHGASQGMRCCTSRQTLARNSVRRENNIVRQCDNVEFRQRSELPRLVLQCVDHVVLSVDGTGTAEFEKVVGKQKIKFTRGLAQILMQQALLKRENVFAKGSLHYAP